MTVLRAARAPDAPACAAILADWVAETPWMPALHRPQDDLRFVGAKIAEARSWVAEGDGIEGFMVLEGDYVACLYVAASARGRGVGKALLDRAKAAAPQGFRLWTFQNNTGARRFYTREGLTALRFTNGAENEEGLPDVEFGWPGALQGETGP